MTDASPTSTGSATIVLVHGAFHGPWCFELLVDELQTRGIRTIAPELPLTGLADDAAAVTAALDAIDDDQRPVTLLGHSWGGAVITVAGNHPAVERLVYLAAMAPDTGESSSGGPVEIGQRLLDGLRPSADGALQVDPEQAVDIFYPDADPEDAQRFADQLRSGRAGGGGGDTIEQAAWRTRPTTYVVCADDPIVLAAGQRALAERTGGTVHELPGDHSPFLARPTELADLIEAIVD